MGSVNSLVFPAPEIGSYNLNHPNLVYIPRFNTHLNSIQTLEKPEAPIPCIFLPVEDPCSNILIYFHGNKEDA